MSDSATWTDPPRTVLEKLRTTRNGLAPEEALRRLRRFGANKLRAKRPRSAWAILTAQFRSVVVALLAVAAATAFVFGRDVEGSAVSAAIALNALMGFAMELRATRSMDALRRLGQITTTVRRGGDIVRVPATDVVQGDIVVLEAGDVITADLRLVEANKLQADESMLTGESAAVAKTADSVPADRSLAERSNTLFKGTTVTRGSGEGVVVATGMATELGGISRLVEESEDETTPLERRLDALGKRLLWLTALVATLVAVTGIATGRDLLLVVETAIALAVATVPEGLPIVATLALARGMWRMAHRNALVGRLSAVETLGSTSVILTDKTGTLTENRLTVTRVVLDSGTDELSGTRTFVPTSDGARDPLSIRCLTAGVLCNNAALREPGTQEIEGVGDPLELALLAAGAKMGLLTDALRRKAPEAREEAFDPETKMMATFHRVGDDYLVAVKGAPEQVLQASTRVARPDADEALDAAGRARWIQRADELGSEGLRVLAMADKRVQTLSTAPYTALTFIGLVGMRDVPRREVREVIQRWRDAGVTLVMVTGDQPATALRVALETGLISQSTEVLLGSEVGGTATRSPQLLEGRVIARTSPRQKLDVILAHQRAGHVVAMIGDGVNDAPALKKADIGIAMGRRGTQVAREAADMVLRDDSLDTISIAIREGRVIFGNIRKFVVYLLSCNVSELLCVGGASILAMPLPILPLQILFLNLVTDVFPALALGACDGEPGVMRQPPRPASEPVLTRQHWTAIGAFGLLITVAVLASLWIARDVAGLDEPQAVTVSFLTLGLGQTAHVFNMRVPRARPVVNEVTRNRWVWLAVLTCAGLLLVAVYAPGLRAVLGTHDPGLRGWAIVVSASLVPLLVGQAFLRHWRASETPGRAMSRC